MRTQQLSRRGVVLVYMTVVMIILVAMTSLGVDLARVQLAKTELQQAADAAARYGASGLKNIINGVSAAADNAKVAAYSNQADGSSIVLLDTDIELVVWNSSSRSYTVTTDPLVANGVRVTAARLASRGTSVPLFFAKLIGQSYCDVKATAIATLTPPVTYTYTIPATSNPFLAGMPPGTVASMNNPHNNPDYAGSTATPKQSPVTATLPVAAGRTMTFDGINGAATNDYNDTNRYTADGNLSTIVNNTNGSENGISDVSAPINCLIGVFLDDNTPSNTAAPASLDFSTSTARDFTSLQPLLKQIFFIGDGRTSSGEVQQFKVPAGATRLFIGTWDSYEWNNNVGTFSITLHSNGTITLVK